MNDYIKRDDVLSEINYHESRGGNIAASIRNAVRRLPAADVRDNVRGEWIHWARSDECSVCGYNTGKYEMGSNFCPNCGADMRGERHD